MIASNIQIGGPNATSAPGPSLMEANTAAESSAPGSVVPNDDSEYEALEAILTLLPAEGIGVLSLDDGFVRCPGQGLHTTPSAACDCRLYVNVVKNTLVPRLYCFHSSCGEVIQACNRRLYQAAVSGNSGIYPHHLSKKGGGNHGRSGIIVPDEEAVKEILAKYPWNYQDILNDERGKVGESPGIHHFYILFLFDDDDVVWIGRDVKDSGSPRHVWRFRPVTEWYQSYACPGAFICPSTFKPGVYSRTTENVVARKYLVVESDLLSRDEVGSIFRWMESQGYILRAVVDTAGKSLHGWFDYPDPKIIPSLKRELTALKCDPKMFGASQPCRLPGSLRDGKFQRLIYFNNSKSLP